MYPAAVLFDALGTLVTLEPPAPALCAELARRCGVEISLAEAERALAAEISYYRANLQRGRDAGGLAALRRDCAGVLRDALPRAGHVDLDTITDILLASLRFSPFDDAAPALKAVRERGSRVVVVSNWDCSLHGVLERAGLAPWCDGILTSAEVGARKPAVAIFAHALELAGCVPAQALHVGDSLHEDVEGARAAGLEAILLRRNGGPSPPGVPVIARLSELVCESP